MKLFISTNFSKSSFPFLDVTEHQRHHGKRHGCLFVKMVVVPLHSNRSIIGSTSTKAEKRRRDQTENKCQGMYVTVACSLLI